MRERRLRRAVRRPDAWIALTLGALLAAGSLAYLYLSPVRGRLLLFLAIELVGGREASIPAGLAAGLDWPTTALAASLTELTMLFLGFPILVLVGASLHRIPRVERLFARAEEYARENPDVGSLALGGLTMMPFLPVGALTSVLIGEIVRLPSRWLLPILAGATILANVLTAYATARLLALFPHPAVVAGGMSALLLVGAGVAAFLHRRHQD